MHAFPSFPRELQSDEDEDEDAAETLEINLAPNKPTNEEKEAQGPKDEKEKTESVHVDHEDEGTNLVSTPPTDATTPIPPQSSAQLIDDLTK